MPINRTFQKMTLGVLYAFTGDATRGTRVGTTHLLNNNKTLLPLYSIKDIISIFASCKQR